MESCCEAEGVSSGDPTAASAAASDDEAASSLTAGPASAGTDASAGEFADLVGAIAEPSWSRATEGEVPAIPRTRSFHAFGQEDQAGEGEDSYLGGAIAAQSWSRLQEGDLPSVPHPRGCRTFEEDDEAMWESMPVEIDEEAMEVLIKSITKAVDVGRQSPSLRRAGPVRPPAMPSPPATPRMRVEQDPRMVRLKVYDLTRLQFIEGFNNCGMKLGLGGIFHVTIEVCNQEWSYGFADSGSGVVSAIPGTEVGHRFRECVELGLSPLTKSQCKCAMMDLAFANEWRGCNYDIIRHNCCHFARVVVAELGARPVPDWVDRVSRTAERLLGSQSDMKNEPEMIEVRALPASCRVSFQTGESLEASISHSRAHLSL